MTRRTADRAQHERAAGPRAGVTLLELLLVMAILAIAVGGGLGMFSALDLGKRQSVGVLKNVLRTAKNTAITQQTAARVRLDSQANVLQAEAVQVVGTWHFEDGRFDGAFQIDGDGFEVEWVEDGFLGDALSFGGRLKSVAEFGVQLDPAFDLSDGFAIECAVRLEGSRGGKLLTFGSAAGIDVGGGGALRGWFVPRIEQLGNTTKGQRVVVQTDPGALRSGRWSRVKLEYDRRELILSIDGVPVARAPEEARVWPLDAPMLISDPARPFPGDVDELIVAVIVADEPTLLGESVTFAKGTPPLVVFDAGGGLDRRVHPEPLTIELVHDDGSREAVHVGRYGTVE